MIMSVITVTFKVFRSRTLHAEHQLPTQLHADDIWVTQMEQRTALDIHLQNEVSSLLECRAV
jgi:hypothetical protein